MPDIELLEKKIAEAQDILKDFGLPYQQHNKISALTLLALSNLKPTDKWENASRKSMTLTKDIMDFVNENYFADYKPNTRESFRKNALKPFIDYKIAELNPDNATLSPNSAKTHYAISPIALNTVRKYKNEDWNIALENYKKYVNTELQNKGFNVLLKKIEINNYKSIANDNFSLGKLNIFIGSNGSGKSNILEALAVVGASKANDLSFDGLYSRGVRIARPDLMLSSFLNTEQKTTMDFNLLFEDDNKSQTFKSSITPANQNDIYTKWIDLAQEELNPDILLDYFSEITKKIPGITGLDLMKEANNLIAKNGHYQNRTYDTLLTDYGIFDLNTKSLRGITSADSKKTPLGLNGEGLDLLIASFNNQERTELYDRCNALIDWLAEIVTDKDDKLKISGYKPGKGTSTLYFKDRYLNKQNNTFSAENSNEGVLHVLFYLALFISNKTPKLFAIDNIETALNPGLCKILINELVELAKIKGKQVLITTHNPAILDGLNLFDDDQRLFEVFRNDEGHTKTRRIMFREDLKDKPYKLSEMWTEGLLGAIPKNF